MDHQIRNLILMSYCSIETQDNKIKLNGTGYRPIDVYCSIVLRHGIEQFNNEHLGTA